MPGGLTISEKILAAKAGKSAVRPGEIVWAEPDVVMLNDVQGPSTFQENLLRLGNRIRYPDRLVFVSDHCVPPSSPLHANLLREARNWAAAYQIAHFYEFEGISHQVMIDRGYVRPGQLIVGADSHTTTDGALGALATGVGATELLGVLATGQMWFRVPATVRVEWRGQLPIGVMARDLTIRLIGDVGHDGFTYRSVEFGGDTVASLSTDERLCLTNQSLEAGAKAGIIAPDEVTIAYLRERLSPAEMNTLTLVYSDPDAEHERVLVYRAEEMAPVVAAPHSPENLRAISEVRGQRIDQAYIGTCAGGRASDIEAAAHILKGRKIAKGVRMVICPASRTVYQQVVRSGTVATLLEAGAMFTAPGCGACDGRHNGTLGPEEVCISTGTRNFKGRMGDPAAEIFSASALSVAAAAVAGEIVDPREFLP